MVYNYITEAFIFEGIGAAGLILIIVGLFYRKRRISDIFFAAGGALLLAYSVHIHNPIFIALQSIFTLVTVFDYVKNRRGKH